MLQLGRCASKCYSRLAAATLMLVAQLHVYALSGSIGDVAKHAVQAEMGLKRLIDTVLIVTAAGMILGALFQFRKHFQNPIEFRLSSVFTLLFTGLALIALALIPMPYVGS